MPKLLDLFCGRGGWSRPALALGWRCIGLDIEDHGYPGEFHKRRLPIPLDAVRRYGADLIVASPPCEEYARYHLPWIRSATPPDDALLKWSVSLIGRANAKVIVECSRFAAWHVPGSRYVRPYALWGDLPAILPYTFKTKDQRRGTASLPRAERAARAAEIPPNLAEWILTTAVRS